jgi:hypothetical protein
MRTYVRMRSREEVELVAELVARGLRDLEISRLTGVPRRTISDWRRHARRLDRPVAAPPDFETLPRREYAYLLGLYLGDGCISEHRREVWRLRIVLDAAYPGIIEECRRSLAAIRPSNRVAVYRRRDSRCIEVSMYWKGWPWLLPQHGRGRKHDRKIELASWQEEIVAANHRAFLRGLIHSDGCRYVAHERKNGRHRYSVRYAFCNRSDDIKDLFCASCDALGSAGPAPRSRSPSTARRRSPCSKPSSVRNPDPTCARRDGRL